MVGSAGAPFRGHRGSEARSPPLDIDIGDLICRFGYWWPVRPRSAFAALGQVLTAAGVLGLPELSATAAALCLGAAAILVVMVSVLLWGSLRYQRRGAPRFSVETTARVGGIEAPLLDVSERGASVRMARAPKVGYPYVVSMLIPGLDGSVHQATVAAEVRSVRPSPTPENGHVIGMSFTHLSATARDRLAEYCRVLLPARAAAVAIVDEPEPRHGTLQRSRRRKDKAPGSETTQVS